MVTQKQFVVSKHNMALQSWLMKEDKEYDQTIIFDQNLFLKSILLRLLTKRTLWLD